MTLLEPLWLLLAVPVMLLLRHWLASQAGNRHVLRYAFCALLVLALSRPAYQWPQAAGTVVVIADRSASMPENTVQLAEEVIRRLQSSSRQDDQIAVLSFGEQVTLEKSVDNQHFTGFEAQVGDQQSRLRTAIERGLALAPEQGMGRLLVLSDGRHTEGSLRRLAGLANLQQVAIDYRLVERPPTGDLAVERLDVPLQVTPGEGYLLNAWVTSPWPQTVTFDLWRGAQRIATGQRQVPTGRSRLTFRDRATGTGVRAYRLEVRGETADSLPQNNTARFLVSVRGPRPILLLKEHDGGALSQLLRGGGLDVEVRAPQDLDGRLEDLAGYSALILENVSASALGDATMESITAWVRETGAGLMVTGGRHAYGVGGYYSSPLEDALPVSMELRQEHRKLPLAIVVALDRSGSMAGRVAGNLDKMDLANRATVEVLDLLEPLDEFGVIAVDSAPYVVQKLTHVTETSRMRREILEIDSLGGGIFVYEALYAAAEQLMVSKAPIRHILLFADAADAENPGDYRGLIERCRAVGITISVIGLGTSMDRDAELLRDIANLGGGQIFFTESARELPRLFAQDTFLVSRGAFLEQETGVQLTAGFELLTGQSLARPPTIGGYNMAYLRPEAQLVGRTEDSYEAPWIASWTYGLGRVVTLTSEVDGSATGRIGSWRDAAQLLTGLARWTAGTSEDLGNAVVTQEIEGGELKLEVHLDPRTLGTFDGTPAWRSLRGVPGVAPEASQGTFRWRDPHTLDARLALHGDDVALTTVELAGRGQLTLPPARLPYSPEFQPHSGAAGHRNLEALAKATGGRQRLDIGSIWRTFPRQRRQRELTPWLLAIATLLLLLEVLERRTAVLSRWASSLRRRPSVVSRPKSPVLTEEPSPSVAPEVVPSATPKLGAEVESDSETHPTDTASTTSEAQSLSSALSRARRRASQRQRRD